MRARLKSLFSCCPARISRHCTSGSPASIMTENWRVKMASSFESTLPPKVGRLNSLPFSDILVGVICWRRRMLASSDLFGAASSPLTLEPARLVPRYVKTGMFPPPQSAESPIAGLRDPLKLLALQHLNFPAGCRARHAAIDHVLQLISIRSPRKRHIEGNQLLEICIRQSLVEGLHARLACTRLHSRINLVDL